MMSPRSVAHGLLDEFPQVDAQHVDRVAAVLDLQVGLFDFLLGAGILDEHRGQAGQDRQPDGGFRSGHRQDEKDKNLPRRIAQIVRKRDEVHVHREQHQFDRHQQNDDVPAVQEDPDHADREEDRAQHQIMRQRNQLIPLVMAGTRATGRRRPRSWARRRVNRR